MKAYIDVGTAQLITIGFQPDLARELMLMFGLKSWAWIDENDRAIPVSWEPIWADDKLLSCPHCTSNIIGT